MCEMWKRKQIHEHARKMHRTKIIIKNVVKWRRSHLGGHDLVRRMERQGGGPDMVQKVFGICEAKNATEIDELLQTGTHGHPSAWQNVEEDSGPGRW